MVDAAGALAVQYVRLIAEQIERMGVLLPEWLALSGLLPGDLARPDFVLDLPTFRSLALDALRLSGEPALGLWVGEGLGVQAHGALGYAAASSRTLREVLALIERYIGLRIALLSLELRPQGSELHVVLNEVLPLGDIRELVLEGAVCSIHNVLEDVSTGACAIERAVFPFADPGYRDVAETLLGCPVSYGASWAGLVLPLAVLDQPLKMSDPKAFRLAEELWRHELLALKESRSWAARVQRVLLETRIGFPSLDETARRLHVTPRTLHRRLVAEDTSYRAIVEELRHRSATDLLAGGDASIEEVAYILGYSDPANFRRAFRRWTGGPPSRFRAQTRAQRRPGTAESEGGAS